MRRLKARFTDSLQCITLPLVMVPLLLLGLFSENALGQQQEGDQFKILHIMSYHSPWKWTDDQLNGFKYALKDLNVEYKVFQMDSKRERKPGS